MSKKQISNYKFVPGVIPPAFDQYTNAVALIAANRDYIINEVSGYMTFATGTPSYAPVAANAGPYAIALLNANKTFIQEEATAWIQSQIDSATFPFVGYDFDSTKSAKCKRDIGYLIDAFVADLTGGGNAETIRISRMFFLQGDAQLLNPVQEAATHDFVKSLMTDYVLVRSVFASIQSVSTQVLLTYPGESNAITKIGVLNDIVINLINNGVGSLPAISYNFNALFAEYVYGATKCKRDIGYVLDAVSYDVSLGTNYNAVFIGHAESNSLDYSQTVIDAINASKTRVLALSAVSSSSTAVSIVNSDYTEILNVAGGGTASAVTFSNPSGQTSSLIAIKDQLAANRAFIQAEVNAWVAATYPAHNHSESKCARDVGYAVDAFCYDMLYGGNSATYDNAKFFFYSGASGITAAHKAQTVAAYGRLKTIIGQIVQGITVTKTASGSTPNTLTQSTSGNVANTTDATAVQALAQVIADVVNNGSSSLPGTRTAPSIAWATSALQAASTAITTNKTTIQNAVVTYSDYTYDDAKCRRDTGYVVDSYLYDMTNGGNSMSYYVASMYYQLGVAQVNRPQVEVMAQTFARNLINNYVLANHYAASYATDVYQVINEAYVPETNASSVVTVLSNIIINTLANGLTALPAPVAPDTRNGGLMPNAVALLEANKRFIQEETIAFIQYNIDNNISPYVFYTYNADKCRRDVSYVLEGYISDMRHGGNRQTYFNANKYWESGVAQVDGDRQPEVYAHTFIRNLIENYIWDNVAYTPKQILVSQVFDLVNLPEIYANTRIKELSNTILGVIEFGTTRLPTKVSNRGYVKFPGYYKLKDVLLITNTSRNTILYNFADPSSAAEATYSGDFDSDFPGALYGNDKITTLTLDVDTSGMMVTDNLQIFVEGKEQEVIMNRAGRDAMERMKVGIPQSMLDADFEYGLQPTKWQAISLMRNYPSIYEIPGSDIAVTNVVTDASSGTGGTGASLITVTTQNSHGLSVNDPITIKALANTISGFSRAEGSFLISSVPTLSTFTYYAKSKVGTSNGQILASTYTQLRKGGFYTGSAIGNPTYSVYSSGSSGTVTTALITPAGRDVIGFSGSPPPVGSPLSGTGLTSGAQVTAVTGPGGTAASTTLVTKALVGATTFTVTSTTGISPGLVFDRGDGVAAIVTDVSGNVISLSSALTSIIIGTTENYPLVTQSTTSGTGTGGVFTIARTSGTYSTTVTTPGNGYAPNDTITIAGTSLGGTAPTNNATITVTTASDMNTVATFNNATLVGGTGYIDSTGNATSGGTGTGLLVDIVTDGLGVITSITVNTPGKNYTVGDIITVSSGNGDATIDVATVNEGGVIQSVSTAGTPITAPTNNFISAFTISESTLSQIAAGNTGINYSAIATIQVSFSSPHGFVPGDTITSQITSSGVGAQLAAGPFFVEQVPDSVTMRFTARAAGAIDNTLSGVIYARPDCYFVHRPFDGGVQLGTASPAHGASAIRMSKKYIRYQSGKGVMYNTGALFAPSYDIRSLTATGTAVGSVITLSTDDTDHGCQVGGIISIQGCLTAGYDGTYTVTDIINERQLSVIAGQVLGATTGLLGSPCQMSIRNWHGSTVRSGIFDDQNGMFWQYDGIRMAVVRRSSTNQLAGTIAIAANSNTVVGNNTRFTNQLAAGDRVVIRGMSHVVTQVISDTSLNVAPDYRGVNDVTEAKMVKTIDLVIPQENWNLDPLNGSGPSGYNIDVSKMQMIGIQHTWYGAGFIDFMLRGPEGNYTWAHRFRNSNVNTEAYMRTGNQPVRYEVINEGAKDKLSAAMTINQTTIPLTNAYWFPNSGTVMVDSELIRFTGNTGTTLTGCTRGASLTQFVSGSQRNFTGSAPATHSVGSGVVLISNTITPNISHWGSAFMIDGQFDSDRGYIFNYAATAITASLEKTTAFLIRLAPSVSNAQVGDLGDKELLNRAQLLLSSISCISDTVSGGGAIVIEGVLNPANYPTDPTKITWTGLASSAAGGQPSFAQIAAGGSVTWSGNVSTSTATIQGAFTTTLTAKSFAPVTNSLTATAFNPVTQTVTAPAITSVQNATYQFAFDSTRNDFLIPQSSYAALTTTMVAGDSLSLPGGGAMSGVTIAGLAGQFTCTSTTIRAGETITISGALSTTAFALSGVAITGSGGQFSCNAASSTLRVGQTFTISGNITSAYPTTGSIQGYANPTTYVISATNGSTTFTLQTLAGGTVNTVAGTPSGGGVSYTVNAPSITGYTNPTTYKIAATNGTTTFTLTTLGGAAIATTGGIATGLTLTVNTFLSNNQKVASVTPNYITINAVPYARIVMNANASITGFTNTGVSGIVVSSALATTYNTALSNARTDFLIPQTQYASSTITVTDVLSATTYLTGGQGIASITPNYVSISGVSYARIGMTGAATTTSTAGAGNNVTVTSTSAATSTYGSAISSSRSDFLITDASYTGSGIAVGDVLSLATYLIGGQTISSIVPAYINIGGTSYTRIVMSGVANASSTSGGGNDQSVTLTAAGSSATYQTKNYLFFTSATWLASGATVGTKVATDQTAFPAGTSVAATSTRTFGATTVYRVTFTQTTNTTLSAGGTLKFQFGSAYAVPGEQVFSFITNPGNSDTLSLDALKELTATAIGGRGTFPNGPDVLAINIYKVAGSSTPANLILRWGEAQA
jgi:hypothetical protein